MNLSNSPKIQSKKPERQKIKEKYEKIRRPNWENGDPEVLCVVGMGRVAAKTASMIGR